MNIKIKYNEEEWNNRVNLAACYHLADYFKMSDIIWNHITSKTSSNTTQSLPSYHYHQYLSIFQKLHSYSTALYQVSFYLTFFKWTGWIIYSFSLFKSLILSCESNIENIYCLSKTNESEQKYIIKSNYELEYIDHLLIEDSLINSLSLNNNSIILGNENYEFIYLELF